MIYLHRAPVDNPGGHLGFLDSSGHPSGYTALGVWYTRWGVFVIYGGGQILIFLVGCSGADRPNNWVSLFVEGLFATGCAFPRETTRSERDGGLRRSSEYQYRCVTGHGRPLVHPWDLRVLDRFSSSHP